MMKTRLAEVALLLIGLASAGTPRLLWAQDDHQRSYQIDRYEELAKSGSLRGETIYLYKCFYCHNQIAKHGSDLHDLFKRPKLVSGEPVNERTVTAVIKNGTGKMPAYRFGMSEPDLQDLVSYLKS